MLSLCNEKKTLNQRFILSVWPFSKLSQRAGIHRNFKMKAFGGMNTKDMMKNYDEIEGAKLKAARKTERKSAKNWLQAFNRAKR
jgi:hypothetical protein